MHNGDTHKFRVQRRIVALCPETPGPARSSSAARRPKAAGNRANVLPLASEPSPVDTPASVAVSQKPATSSLASPKAAWGASHQAERSDDGLLRARAGESQGPTDVLTVDASSTSPRVMTARVTAAHLVLMADRWREGETTVTLSENDPGRLTPDLG